LLRRATAGSCSGFCCCRDLLRCGCHDVLLPGLAAAP
jgi:hypothetical protein